MHEGRPGVLSPSSLVSPPEGGIRECPRAVRLRLPRRLPDLCSRPSWLDTAVAVGITGEFPLIPLANFRGGIPPRRATSADDIPGGGATTVWFRVEPGQPSRPFPGFPPPCCLSV